MIKLKSTRAKRQNWEEKNKTWRIHPNLQIGMTEWQKKNITNEITRKHFRTYDVAQKSTCLLYVRTQQTQKGKKEMKKERKEGHKEVKGRLFRIESQEL